MKQLNRNKPRLANSGFTIIELMIATTVFSLVLLLCTFGLLQVSRVYYKGITGSKVQETLRTITDEVSRAIQFDGGSVVPTPSSVTAGSQFVFCISDQRYSVVTGRQLVDGNPDPALSQVRHALVVDTVVGCNAGTTPQDPMAASVNGRELLAPRMRLVKFEVLDKGDNLYAVNARVAYGDNDLLCSPAANDCNSSTPSSTAILGNNDLTCKNIRAGTQFCAVAELNTVVQKRL